MTFLLVLDVFQGLYDHRFTSQIYGAVIFMTVSYKGVGVEGGTTER